jgi:putative transcriptional regulator
LDWSSPNANAAIIERDNRIVFVFIGLPFRLFVSKSFKKADEKKADESESFIIGRSRKFKSCWSRVIVVTMQVPDVKSARRKLGASQSEFAKIMGISKRTVQNWEQGLRVPNGPARVLLEIAAPHPELLQNISRKRADTENIAAG